MIRPHTALQQKKSPHKARHAVSRAPCDFVLRKITAQGIGHVPPSECALFERSNDVCWTFIGFGAEAEHERSATSVRCAKQDTVLLYLLVRKGSCEGVRLVFSRKVRFEVAGRAVWCGSYCLRRISTRQDLPLDAVWDFSASRPHSSLGALPGSLLLASTVLLRRVFFWTGDEKQNCNSRVVGSERGELITSSEELDALREPPSFLPLPSTHVLLTTRSLQSKLAFHSLNGSTVPKIKMFLAQVHVA